MASCISVVRMGPFPESNDCAIKLKTALRQYLGGDTLLHSAERDVITLSNKYFDAQICLVEIGSTMDHSADAADGGNTFAEDGIVLVFDSVLSNLNIESTNTASFDNIEAVHDQAVNAETPAGDLLRLCVGVGKNECLSTKEYEQEYSRRVLWCLDRGYEYVEADLSDEGLALGHDARDKEGFARIVEALTGTVWSSAVMKNRTQTEPMKSSTQNGMEATSDFSLAAELSEKINDYEPPDPSMMPSVLGIEDEELERKAFEALFGAEGAANDDERITHREMNQTNQIGQDEIEQEHALHALEGSIREAHLLRDLSKSGKLSDNERRKRAGDAAVLLMNMMGQMGFESSDDEEP